MMFGAAKWLFPFVMLMLAPLQTLPIVENQSAADMECAEFLTQLFEARSQLLVNQNEESIKPLYEDSGDKSKYAFSQEVRKMKYMSAWAAKRGLNLTHSEGEIRIIRMKVSDEIARISLVYSLKITYEYKRQPMTVHSFGVGTRHGITLHKSKGKWVVFSEWYLDPLDENPMLVADEPLPPPNNPSVPNRPAPVKQTQISTTNTLDSANKKGKYNRARAVQYADKYAGLAWGAGNNHKYNSKYQDYTGIGGDCTNFASQALGDPTEGGGLPMRHGWYYQSKVGGSVSWVRTDGLKNFLLSSGAGKLIAKGTYTELMKISPRFPQGALAELMPGDLIGYEMQAGDVDHFGVVTGRDPNGYVLVNSHSGDRYHVPWDVGWDKWTRYLLIHIKD